MKKLLYYLGIKALNDEISLEYNSKIRGSIIFIHVIGLIMARELLLDKISIKYRLVLVILVLYIAVEICYKMTIYFYKKNN